MSDLLKQAAESVLQEFNAGRQVDPTRVRWAQETLTRLSRAQGTETQPTSHEGAAK